MTQNFNLGPQKGPELKSFLLAGVLMAVAVAGINYFFPNAPVIAPTQQEAAPVQAPQAATKAPTPAPLAAVASATPNTLPLKILSFDIDVKSHAKAELASQMRGGYQASISNHGAQINHFALTGYENPIDLNSASVKGAHLFALTSRDASLTLPLDAAYKVISSSENKASLERVTPEGIRIVRDYTFNQDNFTLSQDIAFYNETNTPRPIAVNLLMANVDKHTKQSGFFGGSVEALSAVCKTGDKRESFVFKDLSDKTQIIQGALSYAAFDERYFLSALMPQNGTVFDKCRVEALKDDKGFDSMLITLESPVVMLAPQAVHHLHTSSYLGPKEISIVTAASPILDENINFGFFGIISKPMLWLLMQIQHFVLNFGLAIILLTLVIKLITFPLTQKSYVSMQQMKTIAPDIKALQQKYAGDRTTLGQKQMELYKQKGINPMAGCLPMLVQMPIWIALYQMLANSVELYQQPFMLWVSDLTQPDPYYVLPILMGVSMFVQTAFQPVPEDQPQMKYVFWFMPFFFTFIMLKMPAGLNLYILVNNILTLMQQLYIKRRYAKS